VTHPDLLVGIPGGDDAAVYRLADDLALVQTVDFFTPIVDEARDWGRIAAANALSDVYAMGARPLTALQLVGWPRDRLPLDLLGDVLEGGAEVLAEAGCLLAGGHSIDDREPKYGFAVTGIAHPDELIRNAAARPGDVLVLTKPIGTGIIATAIKQGIASVEVREAAVGSMVALNAPAAVAAVRVGVVAGTDVTGFGLLGHLGEVVRASGVSAHLDADAVPLLPGVRALAERGAIPGGTRRNLAAVERFTDFVGIDETTRLLLADAQTSGGLLLAVPEPKERAFLHALTEEGAAGTRIGRIVSRAPADEPDGRIVVDRFPT